MRPAYIFDIDGTVADITHRLHLIKGKHLNGGPDKPDWDAFHDACVHDAPIWPVIKTIQRLAPSTNIILVTGRMEPWRKETADWLRAHKVPWDLLYMRAAKDHRPDFEIKREIYQTHLASRWNVIAVFDDRTRVVEMWRSLGLPCFQVANGDY